MSRRRLLGLPVPVNRHFLVRRMGLNTNFSLVVWVTNFVILLMVNESPTFVRFSWVDPVVGRRSNFVFLGLWSLITLLLCAVTRNLKRLVQNVVERLGL